MEEQIEQGTEIEIKDPKAVLEALNRAKSEAKKYREEKEELAYKLSALEDQNAQYSGALLRQKTKERIAELGVKDADRLLKYIDFQKLDADPLLNEIHGLDEQIDSIKQDLPELFDPKLRVGGQADAADKVVPEVGKSASELQARYLLGR